MEKLKSPQISNEILNNFRNKKLLYAHWDAENKQDYSYQNWYLPFRKIFGKFIVFSPKKNYFNYGKEEMNRKFLELVKREKPDYVFFLLIYDEFDPLTFLKIKEISPNTKIINVFTDDFWRYEDFGRYYAIFSDYVITNYHKTLNLHKKAGIKNVFFFCGVNLDSLKPLNIEKKYDVVFIGASGSDRVEYLKFLVKKGIKVDIWGRNWPKYDEFKNNYHGPIDLDEWVRTVNQSKINLAFSIGGDGKPQLKGRPFEIAACKSFSLVGYCKDYLDFFKNKKEIIMFKNKEDFLKKIIYYLKNEKEREKIAEATYKKVIKNYSTNFLLNQFFKMIMENEKKKLITKFPEIKQKISYLSEKDLYLSAKELKQRLKNFKYICFDTGTKIHQLRNFIQAHSLEKSKKQISCCDYYVNSNLLGNYLLFKTNLSFGKLPKKEFDKLLNISQIMVRKDFFFQKINDFKKFFKEGKFNLINSKNTAFISIPLVEINNINVIGTIDYKYIKEAFQMKFLDKLYSLNFQKKLFSIYPLWLFLESMKKKFIITALKDAVSNKNKLYILKKGV